MLGFARRMAAWRLASLDLQLVRSQRDQGADAVHDLRVAARRLQYTLDCFSELLAGRRFRRLRKRVKALLAAGGAVRDRDIALGMAADAGLGHSCGLVKALTSEREAAARALLARVSRRRYQGFALRWSGKLDLPAPSARPNERP